MTRKKNTMGQLYCIESIRHEFSSMTVRAITSFHFINSTNDICVCFFWLSLLFSDLDLDLDSCFVCLFHSCLSLLWHDLNCIEYIHPCDSHIESIFTTLKRINMAHWSSNHLMSVTVHNIQMYSPVVQHFNFVTFSTKLIFQNSFFWKKIKLATIFSSVQIPFWKKLFCSIC